MAKKGSDIWERSYGIPPKGGAERAKTASRAAAALDRMPEERRRRAYALLCAAVLAAFLACVAAGSCMSDRAQPPAGQQDAAGQSGASAAEGSADPAEGSSRADDPRLRFSGLSSLSFMEPAQVDAACAKARAHFEEAGFADDEVLRVFAIPGDETVFWVAATSEPEWAEATPAGGSWDEASIEACEKPERLSEYLDSRSSGQTAPATSGGSDVEGGHLPDAAAAALSPQAAEFLASRGEPCREDKTAALSPTIRQTDAGVACEVSAWLENGESRRLSAEWNDSEGRWAFDVLG